MEALVPEVKIWEVSELPAGMIYDDPECPRKMLTLANCWAVDLSLDPVYGLRYSFTVEFELKHIIENSILIHSRDKLEKCKFEGHEAALVIVDYTTSKAYSRQIKSDESLNLPTLKSKSSHKSVCYYVVGPKIVTATVVDYLEHVLDLTQGESWDPLQHGFVDSTDIYM